jgi:hypothetical protein
MDFDEPNTLVVVSGLDVSERVTQLTIHVKFFFNDDISDDTRDNINVPTLTITLRTRHSVCWPAPACKSHRASLALESRNQYPKLS